MCYFIILGAAGGQAAQLARRAPRGMDLAPVENPSVLVALPGGFRTWLLTSGGCSCDLYVSPTRLREVQHDLAQAQARREARQKRRRAQAGWSEAKIARAARQSQQSASLPALPTWQGYRDDVRVLISSLAAELGPLALVVHWYDEPIETARLEPGPARQVSRADFAAGLAPPQEDELVWIDS